MTPKDRCLKLARKDCRACDGDGWYYTTGMSPERCPNEARHRRTAVLLQRLMEIKGISERMAKQIVERIRG